MKKISLSAAYKPFLVFLFSCMQLVIGAQDTSSTSRSTTVTTETTSTTDWYAQPWVWIVGGAVLLIILVALLRGNSSNTREREVTRTTVIKDER